MHTIPFPELLTERLKLRRLTEGDGRQIFLLRSDVQVNKYLDRLPAESLEAAVSHMNKVDAGIQNNQLLYWGISLGEDPLLIGAIGLWNISLTESSGEIGFELLPQFQRRGIMTEALIAVLRYAFDEVGFIKLFAWVNERNQASIALLKKVNFEQDVIEENRHSKNDLGEMAIYSLQFAKLS